MNKEQLFLELSEAVVELDPTIEMLLFRLMEKDNQSTITTGEVLFLLMFLIKDTGKLKKQVEKLRRANNALMEGLL